MQKITPQLWFDDQAKEAAQFYVSAFGNGSKINSTTTLNDTPSGEVDSVTFELLGHSFMAISAGPHFTINPSISFFVNFDPLRDDKAEENLDALWEKLSEGGTVLMPFQEYPFSKRYGWLQDRYGVSWQIVPREMDEMMTRGTREQVDRVTQAFLPMKKLIISDLQKAFKGQ